MENPTFLVGEASCSEKARVLGLLDRGAHHRDHIGVTGEGPLINVRASDTLRARGRDRYEASERTAKIMSDSVPIPMRRDEAQETVQALDGAQCRNRLFAGEGAGGRQDA